MMNVLGLIPARAGSKGFPNKNLLPLAGKPLLAYVAEASNSSGVIDRLILSTDSTEIAKLGRSLGIEVPFIRPGELANDDTPMFPVVQHAVNEIEKDGWAPEILVLLQPTSPLRSPDHIRQAVEMLKHGECDSVVSVIEIPHLFAPQKALHLHDGFLGFWWESGSRITRRQQLEPTYAREGTIYACLREVLSKKSSLYGNRCLPLVLSNQESLSIDSVDDWRKAESLLGEQEKQTNETQ